MALAVAAGGDQRVAVVQRRGAQAHQDLAGTRDRVGPLDELEAGGTAEVLENDRFHVDFRALLEPICGGA